MSDVVIMVMIHGDEYLIYVLLILQELYYDYVDGCLYVVYFT